MHHKRRRPKHLRRGCLRCKPHKHEAEVATFHVRGLKSKIDRNQLKQLTTD